MSISESWLVVVPLPIPAVEFLAPYNWKKEAPVGHRVLVPWRSELIVGILVGVSEQKSSYRHREVVAVLDDLPWVSASSTAGLSGWAKDSHIPEGLSWSDMLGIGWKASYTHRVRAVSGSDLKPFGEKVPTEEWSSAGNFSSQLLDKIREQGLLEEAFAPLKKMRSVISACPPEQVPLGSRTVQLIRAVPCAAELSEKQAKAHTWLLNSGHAKNITSWAKAAGTSPAVATKLLELGAAEYFTEEKPVPEAWKWLQEVGTTDSVSALAKGAGISISAAGALISGGWAKITEVEASAPSIPQPEAPSSSPDLPDNLPVAPTWRLHGGRSKDRFAQLAPRLLSLLRDGRGVLVLTPDAASLQTAWAALSGCAEASGTSAVQISGTLNEAQRELSWQLVQNSSAKLVIGSYLAMLAPIKDLSLVVITEEASDAYKIMSGSRAFVPDIAQRIANSSGASVAYVGSSPAAESVPLTGLVLKPPRSRVHVVDYASPKKQPEIGPLSTPRMKHSGPGYPISHDLVNLLNQVSNNGRQAVLLAPRRGYSALLRCPSCEAIPQCKNCDIALRFHQEIRQLNCHQCGYHITAPDRCSNCGDPMWQAKGAGTEWILQELRKLVPGAQLYRLDKDHKDDLTDFAGGKSGILVGTQMVLSQPCPPNLALIGITLADTWLSAPDFRASERYHRLLRQLVEWHPTRAPLLVVQTFQASHDALRSLIDEKDALHYPSAEERTRKALGYPPHSRLAQIEVSAREAKRAEEVAAELAKALYLYGAKQSEVLGPAPSSIAKLRGAYPYHILLKTRTDERLGELLKIIDSRTWKARIRVDINPRTGL